MRKNNIEFQLGLLELYGITDLKYTIENDKLVINRNLCLNSIPFKRNLLLNGAEIHKDFLYDTIINGNVILDSLTKVHKDLFKNTTFNGSLYLNSLIDVHKNFLKNAIINGNLYLNALVRCHKNFLKNAIINGDLYLNSLTEVHTDFITLPIYNIRIYVNMLTESHKNFLKDTTFNGYLSLNSLNDIDKSIFRTNIKKLKYGYNSNLSYCYFPYRTLSKVISIDEIKDHDVIYTVYTTPIDLIVQKNKINYAVRCKTIKQGIDKLNNIRRLNTKLDSTKTIDQLKQEYDVAVHLYKLFNAKFIEGYTSGPDYDKCYNLDDVNPPKIIVVSHMNDEERLKYDKLMQDVCNTCDAYNYALDKTVDTSNILKIIKL
jgi:hypothetical protein